MKRFFCKQSLLRNGSDAVPSFWVFASVLLLSILRNPDEGYAFEAHTLTNQRTTNFHACEQGKCQGPGQDGGENTVKIQVGPFQNSLYYRIGDVQNDIATNSMAGGIDPGADSQLGTGLAEWKNPSTTCRPGIDPRCVADTNDAQPCAMALPSTRTPGDCSSRTTVFASTALPKHLYEGNFDKQELIVTDQRITGSKWSITPSLFPEPGRYGFGTPSTDSFVSWGYDAGGIECPGGAAPPCRINRIDFGMVSIYINGNAGFTSDNSARTAYVINSITDGNGKIIGHIRTDRNGNEIATCGAVGATPAWTANTGAYGAAATCLSGVTIQDPQSGTGSKTVAIVLDGRATGWSRTDYSFNPGGGTACGSSPTEAQLLTCGSWNTTQQFTTFKATQPTPPEFRANPTDPTGDRDCLFRGTILGRSSGSICDNVKFDDGTMGEPASPLCAGLRVGPTDQHGDANGTKCNDIP